MRYTQLRAFHYVALHEGFSRAADALSLTQPAVSEQIRRLERDHDVLLFHRDGKRIGLTKTGENLFALTRQMFEVEDRIAEMLSESRSALEGTLRIVADSTYHITSILKEFRDSYPGVFVDVQSGNTADVLQRLRDYDADIGVAGTVPDAKDLETVDLGQTPIIAFAARGEFPADKSDISLDELKSLPLVFREQGSTTRARLEAAASKAGAKLTPAIQAEGREAVREIVASGTGVGFVSVAEFGHDDRITGYPIFGIDAGMAETVICLSQRHDVRVIRAFMETARAHVRAER